jgi:hypothetical protein
VVCVGGGGLIVPAQPHHEFKGQVAACWRHSLSNKEALAFAAGALRCA